MPVVHTKMFNAKWRQTALCCRDHWISQYAGGGGQDSSLEPSDQVVKVEEGWGEFGVSAPCWVAK